jgi:hypothetical protein
MDYTTWEERNISVNNILLDSNNPRIPPADKPFNQRSLLAELVQHDKIYELAQNIAQNGYYPVESLIVVKENGKIVVIEGNRRLAALKLLIAPEAAPENQISKFQALSNKIDKTTIKKVKVVIAPNREATVPILMSRHTHVQIERWDTLMQATFYNNFVKLSVTVEDVSRDYNVPKSKIIEAIRLHRMYKIACSLDLPEEELRIVQNPREFDATTLKRFYERPVSQEFLGIELSSEVADVIGVIDENEFKKGYKKVVTDIATGKQDSRSLGTTKQIKKYIDSIPEENRPDQSKKGSFTSDTILKGIKEETVKIYAKGVSAKKLKRPPTGLIPNSISCEVNNQRINNIFSELRTLPVGRYPNATAVLLRSLLEMSLCHYLSITGDLNVIIHDEKDKRRKKNQSLEKDWQPSLKRMLNHLLDPKCTIIKNNPNQLKVLKKFILQREELFSHDSLNFFVHNQYYPPNDEMLRGFWGQLEGLFQIILVEPDSE